MVTKLCNVFNHYCSTCVLSEESYEFLTKSKKILGSSIHHLPEVQYASNGWMSFSQIATLASLIDFFYDKKTKNLIVIAPTQWGKTSVLLASMTILPVVHYLKTGRLAFSVASVPAFMSLVGQSRDRLTGFWNAMCLLRINLGGNSMTVHEYWEKVGLDIWNPDLGFINRRNPKGIRELEGLVTELSQHGDVFFHEDEGHYGQGKSGCADKLSDKVEKLVYANISLSATPDEKLSSDSYTPVPVFVEDGYKGMDKVFGHQMRHLPAVFNVKSYTRDLPEIFSMTERYGKDLVTDGDFVAAILKELQNSTGVFLRAPERLNSRADNISRMLSSKKFNGKKIEVIRFYEKLARPTCGDYRKEFGPDQPYVIIANNMARMGDTLPYDCFVAIDPTEESSTVNSQWQSTTGRLSGYRAKAGTCILSEKNAALMKDYYKGDGSAEAQFHPPSMGNKLKKASPRTNVNMYNNINGRLIQKGAMHHYSIYRANEWLDDPTMVEIFAELCRVKSKQGSRSKIDTLRFYKDVWSVLTEDRIKYLEQVGGFPLVRPGSNDGTGSVLTDSFESRYCTDIEDYASIAKSGGGHNRVTVKESDAQSAVLLGSCRNQMVFRYQKGYTCPICGVTPGKEQRAKSCCMTHCPVEVFILHMRRIVKAESIEVVNSTAKVVLETNKRSRHHEE